MKSYWLAALLAVLPALAFAQVQSADAYYLEIGKDASKENAQKQWDALAREHKNLLGKLSYFPKAMLGSGVEGNTRIQAGPVDSKEKAQRICGKLFKADIPCFVIEGASGKPPSSSMNLSEGSAHPMKMVQLPWLPASVQSPPPPAPELAPIPQVAPLIDNERTADVKVAEAIRVPLTQSTDQQQNTQVVVTTLPNIKPSFDNGNADSGEGWLIVESFPSEDIASAFWEEARRGAPKVAKKLRVHILQPALAQGRVSLGVGPFANSSDASHFCREGLQARERGLSCRFSASEPGTDNYLSAPAPRRRPVENPAPAAAAKQYWIQVATAGSEVEAVQAWSDMQSKNEDILQGMRNNIAASATDKNLYIVSVGPLTTPGDATAACARLQERAIDCRVSAVAP